MTIHERGLAISTLAGTIQPLLSAGKTAELAIVVEKMLKLIAGYPEA